MDMVSSIAATATDLSAARLSANYSLSVTKMAMETQEAAGQELVEMLSAVPKGQYIDTYA